MSQEQTPETMTADKALTGGKVRPKSKVKVLFVNSPFYGGRPYAIEEVHPALAAKLVENGKAEYCESGKLTEEQKAANKDAMAKAVKAKKRKPGKAKAEGAGLIEGEDAGEGEEEEEVI